MNQKIVLTSIVVASSVLAFSYVADRSFPDDQKKSESKISVVDKWTPSPQSFSVVAGAQPAQPWQSNEQSNKSTSSVEPADNVSNPSALELAKQELVSGLSDDMQAMYAQSQVADLENQQKLLQEVEHPGEDRKVPAEEQRMLTAAISQIPGSNLDPGSTADIVWQPAEDEFALPDDEQFYGAEVDHACADEMCKLQFQGFGNEASRDSAIEKLVTANKIPQGSMIVPDDNDPGRFVVIYPKKQG